MPRLASSILNRRLAAGGVACALALGCAATAPTSAPAARPARPSILLVSVDTLRADRLGCYGAENASTPNIDALAREGTLFEQAVSPAPITLPAHASMLTGLFPHRHGVRDNGLYRLPAEIPTLAEGLAASGYDTAAVVAAAVLDRQYGLARGFRLYDDAVARRADLAIAERPASAVTDAALTAASQLREPFFLFVHYFDPHAAYAPPGEIAARFEGRPYDGEVAYVDRELGRLRRGLGARLEGAAIVLTADHGESLGEHGEATHGVFLYQSTLHVPLLVSAPGWPQARRAAGLASNLDVAPTLFEIAGLPVPAGLDGMSLAAQARAASAAPRRLALESEFGLNSYGWAPLFGLIDGSLKWIGAPEAELYDLASDASERVNLAAARGDDARRLLRAWRESVAEDRRSSLLPDATEAEHAERLARLNALGYVAGSRAGAPGTARLPDPKRAIASLALVNEARQLIGAGRHAEAQRRLEAALRDSPRNVSALTLAGIAHLGTGRPQLALVPLRRAQEVAPANADVAFNLGLACIGTGDAACAEAGFRRALRLQPRYHDAAVNLADLMIQTRRLDEARVVLEDARRSGLQSPLLDFVTGRLAFERGELVAARAPLQSALRSGALPPGAAAAARTLLARLP